jgi:hypothetical protein
LGRKPEADAALAEYIANNQNEGAFQIAEILAFRGEINRAFEWLDRAYAQRDGGLTEMKGDPLLKNSRTGWPHFSTEAYERDARHGLRRRVTFPSIREPSRVFPRGHSPYHERIRVQLHHPDAPPPHPRGGDPTSSSSRRLTAFERSRTSMGTFCTRPSLAPDAAVRCGACTIGLVRRCRSPFSPLSDRPR